MAATRAEIHEWFLRGRSEGRAFMLVCVDEFDSGDYPVYVDTNTDPRLVVRAQNAQQMQRVIEVYDLEGDPTAQLDEHRAWHLSHANDRWSDRWEDSRRSERKPVDVSLEIAGLLDILEGTADG